MSEPKFTKGPWECHPDDLAEGLYWVEPEADNVAEDDANAHLISAAPDMYEALVAARFELWCQAKTTVEDFVTWDAVREIDAALSRARGEETEQ